MTELQIGAMLFLVWNSVKDIGKKKISLISVLIFCVFRLLYFLLQLSEAQNNLIASIAALLTGLLPGLFLCAIGKISRGSLGTGDGIVIMVAGLYIGFSATLVMIMWAFFLAFFWSIGLLLLRKYTPKSRFPFVPFLLMGLLLSIWL